MTEILTGGSYMIGYVQFIKQPFAALVSLSLSLDSAAVSQLWQAFLTIRNGGTRISNDISSFEVLVLWACWCIRLNVLLYWISLNL